MTNAASGLARRKKRYAVRFEERTGITPSRAHRQAKRPLYLVSRAKRRARDQGIEFDITVADLIWPTHCPILGVELDYVNTTGEYKENTPSLDRVKNELGYVKGNVRVISRRANMLKSRFDAATFRRLVDYCEGNV